MAKFWKKVLRVKKVNLEGTLIAGLVASNNVDGARKKKLLQRNPKKGPRWCDSLK